MFPMLVLFGLGIFIYFNKDEFRSNAVRGVIFALVVLEVSTLIANSSSYTRERVYEKYVGDEFIIHQDIDKDYMRFTLKDRGEIKVPKSIVNEYDYHLKNLELIGSNRTYTRGPIQRFLYNIHYLSDPPYEKGFVIEQVNYSK